MVVVNDVEYLCDEERRLKEDRERKRYWKKWGPYVAERQWATGTFSFLRSVQLMQIELASMMQLIAGS
jgi:hypothetical protein